MSVCAGIKLNAFWSRIKHQIAEHKRGHLMELEHCSFKQSSSKNDAGNFIILYISSIRVIIIVVPVHNIERIS